MEFLGLILLVTPLGALIVYMRHRDRQQGRKPTLELKDLFVRAAAPLSEAKPAEAEAEPQTPEAPPEIRFKLG